MVTKREFKISIFPIKSLKYFNSGVALLIAINAALIKTKFKKIRFNFSQSKIIQISG